MSARTFGDLRIQQKHPNGGDNNQCSFCKKFGCDTDGLWKYSTRHYVCGPCIEPRKDTVLPRVAKRERFDARMRAAGAP